MRTPTNAKSSKYQKLANYMFSSIVCSVCEFLAIIDIDIWVVHLLQNLSPNKMHNTPTYQLYLAWYMQCIVMQLNALVAAVGLLFVRCIKHI